MTVRFGRGSALSLTVVVLPNQGPETVTAVQS
jgi:hypothetical protein